VIFWAFVRFDVEAGGQNGEVLTEHEPACLPTYLPTYLPAYLFTYLPVCLPTHIPTYLPLCLPTYLPTYLPDRTTRIFLNLRIYTYLAFTYKL
jgi:hypothetical protein